MIKVVNINSYQSVLDIVPQNDIFMSSMRTKVVYEEYIGRNNNGSLLMNPFHIGRNGNRIQVIDLYKIYLRERYINSEKFRIYLHTLAKIADLGILILKCHCKPRACHGDFIKEVLENIIQNGEWR